MYYFKVGPWQKYENTKLNVRAKLANKGFQEDNQDTLY